jgi:hypothetical protein
MKRVIVSEILLLGSVANSAYKEVRLRGADAETINRIFEKIGTNRSFIASPDGSSTATQVTYGDEGGKIVCDARGVMSSRIVCTISADTGYKGPESKVRVDAGVSGEISIVIFKPEDIKKIAETLQSGEFASSARAPGGGPLVRIKCGARECRLTFAN